MSRRLLGRHNNKPLITGQASPWLVDELTPPEVRYKVPLRYITFEHISLLEGLNIMMNRRQFVCTATSAAILVRIPNLFAAETKHDLIIKGGRVIDPSRKLNAIRDVAI